MELLDAIEELELFPEVTFEEPDEEPAHHAVRIVQIENVYKHHNADNLELILLDGYQCVSQKGTFAQGDLAVYIPPDSIVPQTEAFRFIWGPYLDVSDLAGPNRTVPAKRRRITVKRLRGQWSEGLLMPLSAFPELVKSEIAHRFGIWPGDVVSKPLGIEHYDPEVHSDVKLDPGQNESGPVRKRKRPTTLKGWFFFLLHKLGIRKDARSFSESIRIDSPHYDVKSFRHYKDHLRIGEEVVITEKIHGSNARFVYLDGKMYAGSRNLWKSQESKCKWRQALVDVPEIVDICKANPGYFLYGEITPTQKGFDYGCERGEVRFFLFDIRTPEGTWMDHDKVGDRKSVV